MANAVRLELLLLQCGDVFSDAHIDFLVLKGMATCHLDYRSPELRQFGDLDLLVRPDDFTRAIAALEAHQLVAVISRAAPNLEFADTPPFRHPGGGAIDLHQHLGSRVIGRSVQTEALFAETVAFSVGGVTFRALSDTDRMIHAAVHMVASHGSYRRLSSTTDVLVMAEGGPVSPADVLERARSFGLDGLVLGALEAAYRVRGLGDT